MKRFIVITIVGAVYVLLNSVAVFGAVPQSISYQGRLLDSTGAPIADNAYLIKFIIWNDPAASGASNMKWNSNFRTINTKDGLFEYQLGSVVPLPDGLFSSDIILYLGVTKGTDPEMSPRTKLGSVGYAFQALTADKADTADFAAIADSAAAVSDNSVTSAKIADSSIGSVDIDTAQIQLRVVGEAGTGQAIQAINSDGSVTAVAVGTGDITGVTAGSGLAGGGTSGIVSLSIAGGGVTSVHIASNTITSADIATGGVGSAEIADGSVTGTDIASNTITAADIAIGGVGSAEILNNSILNSDISNSAAIAVTKISGTAVNLSSTQTITGQKKFGDSTMIVNNTGIRIGDNGPVAFGKLVQVEREYNTTQHRWGYHSQLINRSSGTVTGMSSQVYNSGAGGYVAAFEGRAGTGASTAGTTYGCFFEAQGGAGNKVYAVYGGVSGAATFKYAGYFQGDVHVTGTLSKAAGTFKIDHPLDPANKYLVHSFVESPDMMNVYNGNVTTDGNGDAVVTLPDYFEALNKDFRYQLTVIGQFAQAIISEKVSGNRFSIKTDLPNVEVSWQVTGVRKDAYAEAHRIIVEPDKPIAEKGLYLHPVELGLSETKQLHYEMNKAHTLERERLENESTQ